MYLSNWGFRSPNRQQAQQHNNGYSDLFIVRYGSAATQTGHFLYLNQDGKSFVREEGHGVVSSELGSIGGGADTFDYDQDGELDLIYGTERGRWRLFTNNLDTTGQNYIVVKVGNSPTGKATANGALLTIKAKDKIYKRVVGATSAACSLSANTHLHVGLGDIETVDEVVVRWTNGETDRVAVMGVNQSVNAGRDRLSKAK